MAPKLKSSQSPGTKRKLKRGFGSSFNDALVKNVKADLTTLDEQAATRYAFIAKWFEKCASDLGGVSVNGKKCMTWTEAMSDEVGLWKLQTYKTVIGYYALKAKPSDKTLKRIDVQTLLSFTYRIHAAHNFWHNLSGDPQLREKLKHFIDECEVTFKLRRSKFIRAALTPASVYALVQQSARLSLPIRSILSIVLFQAICSSTGYRAGSLTRAASKRLMSAEKSGLKYSSITAWAVPGSTGSKNTLIVWISPRSFKATHAKGSSAVLMDNGKIGVSANYLIMMAAELDGVLGDLTVEKILDPAFLGNSSKPRRVVFDENKVDQHILVRRAGGLSLCTSDFVAAAVYQKHDYETAGQIMQHRHGSNVTGRYFGAAL
ncbi:uncharacterized protein I206_100696 [Kwoniella pini CBS 10737]